jgi:hypothetical protein
LIAIDHLNGFYERFSFSLNNLVKSDCEVWWLVAGTSKGEDGERALFGE